MNKALIAVGIGIISFVIGFAGIYFAMPMISPDRVEQTKLQIDSLQTFTNLTPDTTLMALAILQPDSLVRTAMKANTLAIQLDSARLSLATQEAVIGALEDSLASTYGRLQTIELEQTSLFEQVGLLLERLKVLEGQRVEVQDLSKNLPKLEDKDLSALVAQLDLGVLEMLYIEASGRNRTRLLQAMTADRAARFVQHVLGTPVDAEDKPPNPTQPPLDGAETVSAVLPSSD